VRKKGDTGEAEIQSKNEREGGRGENDPGFKKLAKGGSQYANGKKCKGCV